MSNINNKYKKFKKVRHSKIYKANCHLPLSFSREMKRRIGRKTWRKFRKRVSFIDYKRYEYYIPWIRQKTHKRNPYKLSNNADIYKKETSEYCPNCGFKLKKENIIQDNINSIGKLGKSSGKYILENLLID